MKLTKAQLMDGIKEIQAILGPGIPDHLPDEGCRFEWGEALQICRNLVGDRVYDDHWEVEAEAERGNPAILGLPSQGTNSVSAAQSGLTFHCPHMSVGPAQAATCMICGPLEATA